MRESVEKEDLPVEMTHRNSSGMDASPVPAKRIERRLQIASFWQNENRESFASLTALSR